MRVLILLVVVVLALVIVQHERNDCTWGEPGWMDCILTVGETPATDVDSDTDSPAETEGEGPDVSP